jgi:hypothetical protein
MLRTIILATAVAGTLDLLSAFVFAGLAGMGPVAVLQFVASGPLGDRALGDPAYAAVGLLVHYAIMSVMVAAFVVAASRLPLLREHPILTGALYGIGLWFVMYWIVRPMRWENLPPPTKLYSIANQLFSHVILVGIPIGLIAAGRLGFGRSRAAPTA